jgi:rare lipoprotein A
MPDPRNGRVYRVQVGAFSNELYARELVYRLRAMGFNPAYEMYDSYCRVVLPGIQAADIEGIAWRLGSGGVSEILIREER